MQHIDYLENQLRCLLSMGSELYRQDHITKVTKYAAETVAQVNDSLCHTQILTKSLIINVFSSNEDSTKKVHLFSFLLRVRGIVDR